MINRLVGFLGFFLPVEGILLLRNLAWDSSCCLIFEGFLPWFDFSHSASKWYFDFRIWAKPFGSVGPGRDSVAWMWLWAFFTPWWSASQYFGIVTSGKVGRQEQCYVYHWEAFRSVSCCWISQRYRKACVFSFTLQRSLWAPKHCTTERSADASGCTLALPALPKVGVSAWPLLLALPEASAH